MEIVMNYHEISKWYKSLLVKHWVSVVSVMWFLVLIHVLVRQQGMLFGFWVATDNDDSRL